jgi:hemoglobin-like flavoprotein
MAPEFWRGSRWFKQRMEAKLGIELSGEALRRAKLHRSHQFAVGMLAWTMLEGRVPFSPHLDDSDVRDMDRLKEIEEEFLEASEGFSQRVSEARWRVEARALARIIQRMVAHNPAERWSSMDQVRSLVHALAGNYAADELDNLVKEAYQTVACGNSEFYHKFYETLFQNGPHLRAKFPSDMNSQHRMLDYAVGQLLNFNQQQSEPSTLTQFVERHRQLGLSKDDFENFGNALLGTFDAALSHAGKRQRMLAALEIVIWPGIYYMIQHCAPH